jgi:acyl-coenzyme A thioesterase PaaI-like protein
MSDTATGPETPEPETPGPEDPALLAADTAISAPPRPDGPRSLDGITSFIGLRWDDPQTVRLEIRPELINRGGLLSGVATYAMVDYCMGSTLWAQTTAEERIATISISINYIQTALEGQVVCTTVLDRRNRTIGIMKSEIHHEDGRLLVTAIGSYSIFLARGRPPLPPVPPVPPVPEGAGTDPDR